MGAPLPPFHGTVVVTLDAAGGTATLGGTTQVTAVAGVASFADLVIIPSGPGMALIATSGALAPGRSAAFDVVAGTLDHFVFEDAPLTRAAGDAFGFDVLAVDANGTLVDTYAGTATLTSTDAAATLPSNVTFAAGRAHVSATLGTVGTQTVTVTASEDTAITAAFSGGKPDQIVFYAHEISGRPAMRWVAEGIVSDVQYVAASDALAYYGMGRGMGGPG